MNIFLWKFIKVVVEIKIRLREGKLEFYFSKGVFVVVSFLFRVLFVNDVSIRGYSSVKKGFFNYVRFGR